MRDPLGPAPEILVQYLRPWAQRLSLHTFPYHAHELAGAFSFYMGIFHFISPFFSKLLVPGIYRSLPPRGQVNWNVKVVSMVQSTLICAITLYVISFDEERKDISWEGRLFGYSGAASMIQAFAGGYFLWDVVVSTLYFSVLGADSLAHGASALLITCIGFRPFANYYGLNFILYELSTPCLNIHWFLDKTNRTGTNVQLVNGICLMATFFGCRLIWGSYQSMCLYLDVWAAWKNATIDQSSTLKIRDSPLREALGLPIKGSVPAWLLCTYLVSNTLLSLLNFWWFGKMIQALRKRFDKTTKTTKTD